MMASYLLSSSNCGFCTWDILKAGVNSDPWVISASLTVSLFLRPATLDRACWGLHVIKFPLLLVEKEPHSLDLAHQTQGVYTTSLGFHSYPHCHVKQCPWNTGTLDAFSPMSEFSLAKQKQPLIPQSPTGRKCRCASSLLMIKGRHQLFLPVTLDYSGAVDPICGLAGPLGLSWFHWSLAHGPLGPGR